MRMLSTLNGCIFWKKTICRKGLVGTFLTAALLTSIPSYKNASDVEPATLLEHPMISVDGQNYTAVQYLGFNLSLGASHWSFMLFVSCVADGHILQLNSWQDHSPTFAICICWKKRVFVICRFTAPGTEADGCFDVGQDLDACYLGSPKVLNATFLLPKMWLFLLFLCSMLLVLVIRPDGAP